MQVFGSVMIVTTSGSKGQLDSGAQEKFLTVPGSILKGGTMLHARARESPFYLRFSFNVFAILSSGQS